MSNDLAQLFFQQLCVGQAEAGRMYEAVIGVVTDNRDPERLGRVKVKLPVLSEEDSTWWASVMMLGAGKNRGWFLLPEVDDEVLVLFEHGDINRPVIVGALWNGKDQPPDRNPGNNPRRIIKSRAGSRVIFDDERDQLILEDGAGFGRITLDAGANKVTVQSLQGDVCLQAPEGEVLIKGDELEISAGETLELHAGGDMKYGGRTIQMKGATVSYSSSQIQINQGGQAPAESTATVDEIPDPYESSADLSAGAAPATQAPLAAHQVQAASAAQPQRAASPAARSEAPAVAPVDPEPVLVAARWSRARAACGVEVALSARCAGLAGECATFAIRDADEPETIVTSLPGTCGEDEVATTWQTPAKAPPARLVFTVEAAGRQARSSELVLTRAAEATLFVDDEPAAGAQVALRSELTGEVLRAIADADGKVRFAEAPLGPYSLSLEEG
ncbi:MAG: phage baseplate assembly protein V [Kofleriaceae bacterium]